MISYSQGKLTFENKRSAIDFIIDMSLVIMFCAVNAFGAAGKGQDYLYYIGSFLFIGMTAIKALFWNQGVLRLRVTYHTIWYGSFILLGIASSMWAANFSAVFIPMSRMLQILVLSVCISYYLITLEDFDRLLNILLFSFLVMTGYILLRTPVSEWFSGFIGKTTTHFNTNSIGLSASIGTMIAFYQAYVRGMKRYYLTLIPPLALVVMTSSRKSLFMALAGMALIALLNTRSKNYFLRLLVSLGIVAALAFAVIKIPALYRAIGVRLVSMYDYLMNEDYAADFSVSKRMSLIQMAKLFFYDHPFRGIGLNNFAARYSKTVANVGYAHNNFWEIAADLGIIGMAAYYWFYAYLIIRHFKQIFTGNKLSILFFSYVLILLFTEYGLVSYYDRLQQLMLAVSFSALFVSYDAEGNVPASENVQQDDDYGAADYAGGLREER